MTTIDPNAPVITANGNAPLPKAERDWLQQELLSLLAPSASSTWNRHANAESIRHCYWEGQSSDGRVHAADLPAGKPALPFEGASDARMDTADEVINFTVAVLKTAARRAGGSFSGMTSQDMDRAGRVQTLFRYIKDNLIGEEYFAELEKALQWMLGDDPGISVLHVCWHQDVALQTKSLEMIEAAIQIAPSLVTANTDDPLADQAAGPTDETYQEAESLLMDEARIPAGVEKLVATLGVSPARARRILSSFRKGEAAEYPQPYIRQDRPRVIALRPFETVFLPMNTVSADTAPWVFIRELLTAVEVRARKWTMGYSDDFIAGVVGDPEKEIPGQAGISALHHCTNMFNRNLGTGHRFTPHDDLKGLYEVITAYYRASDDDGFPAIYQVAFHCNLDIAATDRKILDYAHGSMPFLILSRERLGDSIYDSRGIPNKVQCDQHGQKVVYDSFVDNVQMATLPPILAPFNRPRSDINLSPIGIVRERRPGEVRFMDIPQFPAAADKMLAIMDRRIARRFGLPHAEVDPIIQSTLMQNLVDNTLATLAQVDIQILQIALQYMSEDQMKLITDDTGQTIIKETPEEIRGRWNLTYRFDARQLDLEFVKEYMDTLGTVILPMDSSSVVDRAALTSWAVRALDPNMADAILRSPEAAEAAEIEDEKTALAKIIVGIEPMHPQPGHDARTRLRIQDEVFVNNPTMKAALDGDANKKLMLERRRSVLIQTLVQEQNKATGRKGAPYATPQPQPDA